MRTGAFTLVELLIVIAIILIVAAFALPMIFGSSNTSVPAGNGVTVDTVSISPMTINQASAYQQAIVDWQIAHPDREIVSTMKAQDAGIDGNKVIITSREKKQQ